MQVEMNGALLLGLIIVAILFIIGFGCVVVAIALFVWFLRSDHEDKKLYKAQKQEEDKLYQGLKDSLLSHIVYH